MTEAYLNNDHTLTVSGLETALDGTDLTNASITYQIYDSDNVAVAGANGVLSQIGTSNDYTTEVDKAIMNLLDNNEEYVVRVTGSDGGYDFEFDVEISVTRRRV